MGLFGSKKEGGILDVIRCDESEYLIWKWSPTGEPCRKMNAIRYGSRLRVKEGEVAVFVYDKEGGMDFIEGFKDEVIKTANFPVLTSMVGSLFGGSTPFQAEIFFINCSGSIRLPFFVEHVNLTEPGQERLFVPANVKGSITFNIQNYKPFIAKYQMAGYDMHDLSLQIREMVVRYVKSVVSNAPHQLGIPVVQIERGIDAISDAVLAKIKEPIADDFAVNIKRLDISDIILDTESPAYAVLLDQGVAQASILGTQFQATAAASGKNILDQQRIGAENLEQTLGINREETQRRQRLATEEEFMTAHRLDVQGEVARTAAENMGEMSSEGGGEGMNPGTMMAGMMMGGAVGSGLANMMGNMIQGIAQPQPQQPGPSVTPPPPVANYYVADKGVQSGPFTFAQLLERIAGGQLTRESYVWKQGMAAWVLASQYAELSDRFGCVPPPPPMP